jgi:transposase
LLVLTEHRRDLAEQRVRTILRMQAVLTAISPALSQVMDLSLRGPVHILTHWQTPAAIRKAGYEQLHALLKQYKGNNAKRLATTVITAAKAQTIRTAGEAAYATILGQLAVDLRDLSWRIDDVDAQIAEALVNHPLAEIVQSMPGMGTVLTAEFLAHAGTNTHPTPARLAAHAGLAPINRDSGGVSGNLKRPQRFHRVLRRVFLMCALSAINSHPESTAYYRRKRAEGMTHRQAIGALGRRRITVLWTMIQNRQPYRARPLATA